MAEKPAEVIAAEEAANEAKRQLEELNAKLADAEKRADDANKKFEMTKTERSEEREKRQKEAEKSLQLEEFKAIQEEKIAEMQLKLTEAESKLTELDPLKEKATQWEAYQEARRSVLLELIPEDRREKFKAAPLDLLEDTVELITGKKPTTFTGGSHTQAPAKPSKWSEMTDDQRSQAGRELPQDELTKLIATG